MTNRNPFRALALDLGATSGRGMVGLFNGATLHLEEIHRFNNGPVKTSLGRCWDMPAIFTEVDISVRKALAQDGDLHSVGCDSWAIDFGLLDSEGNLVAQPFSYHEPRGEEWYAKIFQDYTALEYQQEAAVPLTPILTAFQLLDTKTRFPEHLRQAERFQFVADLVHQHLGGDSITEFSMATTSGLCSWRSNNWSAALINRFGLPREIFPNICEVGTSVGQHLNVGNRAQKIPIRLPACHDTASAFLAAPADPEMDIIISSGTWSMVGMVTSKPIVSQESIESGFGTYGLAKNKWAYLTGTMGLWLLERLRSEETPDISIGDLSAAAQRAKSTGVRFNPGCSSYRNSHLSLRCIVNKWCKETNQPDVSDSFSFARVILENLALFYAATIDTMTHYCHREFKRIVLVGGGARNLFLNQLTANAAGMPVITGLIEATAAGNVLCQAVGAGEVGSIDDIRSITASSWAQVVWEPQEISVWSDERNKYKQIIQM